MENKLCINCIHRVKPRLIFRLFCFDGEYSMCDKTINQVNGQPKSFCSTHRNYDLSDACGKDGRWYEPKKI